jgi:hypothetical protein
VKCGSPTESVYASKGPRRPGPWFGFWRRRGAPGLACNVHTVACQDVLKEVNLEASEDSRSRTKKAANPWRLTAFVEWSGAGLNRRHLDFQATQINRQISRFPRGFMAFYPSNRLLQAFAYNRSFSRENAVVRSPNPVV